MQDIVYIALCTHSLLLSSEVTWARACSPSSIVHTGTAWDGMGWDVVYVYMIWVCNGNSYFLSHASICPTIIPKEPWVILKIQRLFIINKGNIKIKKNQYTKWQQLKTYHLLVGLQRHSGSKGC